MNLVPSDPVEAWHVAEAIDRWRPVARAAGVPVPMSVVLWAEACRQRARTGHHGPALDRIESIAAGFPAMPRILLPLIDAAAALGISERSVKRRVAAGDLPSVKVERRRLVHVDDLTAYADRLRAAGDQEPE